MPTRDYNNMAAAYLSPYTFASAVTKKDDGNLLLPLCSVGVTHHGAYGEQDISEKRIFEFISNFKAMQKLRPSFSINVSFGHIDYSVAQSAETMKSAGEIVGLEYRKEDKTLYGIYKATPEAIARISRDGDTPAEYRGVSMEFFPGGWCDKYDNGKKREDWLLVGAALLNDPHLDLLPTIQEANGMAQNLTPGGQHMDELKELLRLLGVVSFADAVTAINEGKRKFAGMDAQIVQLSAAQPKEGQTVVALSEFSALKEIKGKYEQTIAKQNAENFEREFADAVKYSNGAVKLADKENFQKAYFSDEQKLVVVEPLRNVLCSFSVGKTSGDVRRKAPGVGDTANTGDIVTFGDAVNKLRVAGSKDAYGDASRQYPELYNSYIDNSNTQGGA